MFLRHLQGEVQTLAPGARGEAAQGRDLADIGVLHLEGVCADRRHSTPHCDLRDTLGPRRRDATLLSAIEPIVQDRVPNMSIRASSRTQVRGFRREGDFMIPHHQRISREVDKRHCV